MSDRPSDDGGSERSDAASRLAALLADVVDAPADAPSPRQPAPAAPRRVVRRRDLVEPAEPPVPVGSGAAARPEPPPADPDATQPIAVVDLPSPVDPAPPGDRAEDPAEARRRQREEDVLAEARAVVRPGAPAGPPAALRKQPGKPWSRPAPTPPPAAPTGDIPGPPAPPVPVAPTAPAPAPKAPAPAKKVPAPAPVRARDEAAAPAPPPPAAPPAPPTPAPAGDAGGGGVRPRAPRVTVRAVAFGLALALLVGAVPVLGWVGSQRLLDSKGGEIVEGNIAETEPGYRAYVTPTATALVIHRDAAGNPTSAAILSRGAGDAGGTVLLVPLTLAPVEGSYFHTIIAGYESTQDDDGFRRAIEDVIGIQVPPPIIDVTDESLATLIAPVAPLALNVTAPVTADDGTPFAGPVSLAAEQVGPFMRATVEGEPEIARLERIRDVWVAWLDAIGAATGTEPIGAASTGMGTYLRTLAAGDPVVETLDVEEVPDYLQGSSYVPAAGMNEQIIDAVPFPLSPREGTRFSMELLNGVEGSELPMGLMRDLMLAGGALTGVGNAGSFGQETTTILYKEADWEDEAEELRTLLGEGVEIEQMTSRRADTSDYDMVITIGSGVLSRYEQQEDGGG